jgi:YD repeat-containing protein
VASFDYLYNDANQRVQVNLGDGSFWIYRYDKLGQVISGKRYWQDWTPVVGQQFEYGFDDIGNRTVAKAGGDETGRNLRVANYGANTLNQYTNRDVPGGFDVIGLAFATNSISVNGLAPYRRGEYFRQELTVTNGSAAVWDSVTVTSGTNSVTGHEFVAKTPEVFTHDADGNLTHVLATIS